MEGDNYRIEVGPTGVAESRVWKRPDLSVEQGAALAKKLFAELEALARGPRAKAFLLDLSEAPLAFGSKTEEAMTAAFRVIDGRKTPLALLVSDSPIQRLQLERVVRLGAPTFCRLFRERAEADKWIAEALRA